MTRWEQLAALLTGGNKPNPLLGMMAAQNPLYTADPTQTVDAARAFSQGMSSAAIGSIPGSGVVNAAGIQPRYDENWFIPAGITQGPNIRENLQSGNYLDAGLQGIGLLGDAASVGAMASMVPKSQQRGMIRAFHGSPYDFDEFRLDKIGTGEGAQAYGHGLYFAENEDVAKMYRDFFKQRGADWKDPSHTAFDVLNREGGNRAKTIESLEATLKARMRQQPKGDVSELIGAIDMLKSDAPIEPKFPSNAHMYEVNINADPDKFLDWDKPLTEQPADIQRAFGIKPRNFDAEKKLFDKAKSLGVDPTTLPEYQDLQKILDLQTSERIEPLGAKLARAYRNNMFAGDITGSNSATPDELNNFLLGKNIAGIKYLDQGSRGAGTGTRNYVVFDPKTVEILRKYGLLGLASSGGLFANQDGGS